MAPSRVVESDSFRGAAQEHGADWFLKSEAFEALKDALSRNPLVGKEIEGTTARMLFAHPHHAMPVAVYYTYDGVDVTLVGLRVVGM